MRILLALFYDSFRESIDRRTFFVLAIFAGLVSAATMGLQFEQLSAEDTARANLHDVKVLRKRNQRMLFGTSWTSNTKFKYSLEELRSVAASDGLPESFHQGQIATLRIAEKSSWRTWAMSWRTHKRVVETGEWGDLSKKRKVPDDEECLQALDERLQFSGYDEVHSWKVEEESDLPGALVHIAMVSNDLRKVDHGVRLSLFGTKEIPLDGRSVVQTWLLLQNLIMGALGGFFGLLIFISVSASFIPNMMSKGTLDLYLARPVGRSQLLITKYLAGVFYIGLFSLFMFVVLWLGLAIGTDLWNPRFLWCGFFVTFLFATLYTVVTLVGVLTRSENVSAMVALMVWGLAYAGAKVHYGPSLFENRPWVRAVGEGMYWILPKMNDLGQLIRNIVAEGQFSCANPSNDAASISPWTALGTTFAFLAVCLIIAIALFRRRDC